MKASRLIRTYIAQGATEAMAWEVPCRRRGAAAGFPCCSPTGLVVMKPHLDRYKAAAKAMGGASGNPNRAGNATGMGGSCALRANPNIKVHPSPVGGDLSRKDRNP